MTLFAVFSFLERGEKRWGLEGQEGIEVGWVNSLLGYKVVNHVELGNVKGNSGGFVLAVLVHKLLEVLLAPADGDDGGALCDDFGGESFADARRRSDD